MYGSRQVTTANTCSSVSFGFSCVSWALSRLVRRRKCCMSACLLHYIHSYSPTCSAVSLNTHLFQEYFITVARIALAAQTKNMSCSRRIKLWLTTNYYFQIIHHRHAKSLFVVEVLLKQEIKLPVPRKLLIIINLQLIILIPNISRRRQAPNIYSIIYHQSSAWHTSKHY